MKSRHMKRKVKLPVGTLAYYGPDNIMTTKIVAGVFRSENADPIIRQWVASDCLQNRTTQQQIAEFFEDHGLDCLSSCWHRLPTRGGEDRTISGEDCPFCPYWAGKQWRSHR